MAGGASCRSGEAKYEKKTDKEIYVGIWIYCSQSHSDLCVEFMADSTDILFQFE